MILNIILLILVLGIIIFIHELGHFIFAKKANVYVHEFSLGMGPKIYSKRRKNDETLYCIRAFPIGGYVRLAGEDSNSKDDKKVPKDRRLNNKSFKDKILTLMAGAVFNFILAIILLFFTSLIFGSTEQKSYLGEMEETYPTYLAGMRENDLILEINGKTVNTWDRINLEFNMITIGDTLSFKIQDTEGTIKEIEVTPIIEIIEDEEYYVYGLTMPNEIQRGLINAFEYTYIKFISLFEMMFLVVGNLLTGKLSMGAVSGPVGLYSVMGSIGNINQFAYLVALLSINVGFINLLPFPAFDGGRIFFVIIEKIKGSPVNQKFENTVHTIGFILLLALMLYITVFDIIKLF